MKTWKEAFSVTFFEIERILRTKEEVIVKCITEKQTKDLLARLHESGYTWNSGTAIYPKSDDGCYEPGSVFYIRNCKKVLFGEMQNASAIQYQIERLDTSQVVAELNKNPQKVFVRDIDGLELSVGTDGALKWEPGYKHLKPSHLWTESRLEQVDVFEAMKAYKKGATIQCRLGCATRTYNPSNAPELVDTDGEIATVDGIMSGKWYII